MAALLSLLALVTWRFEITAEDVVAACVLVVLIAGAVWWRGRRWLRRERADQFAWNANPLSPTCYAQFGTTLSVL